MIRFRNFFFINALGGVGDEGTFTATIAILMFRIKSWVGEYNPVRIHTKIATHKAVKMSIPPVTIGGIKSGFAIATQPSINESVEIVKLIAIAECTNR